MRVVLELRRAAVDRPAAARVAQEDAREAPGDLLRDLEEGHPVPGAGRALDLEVVAVEAVEVQEAPDDQGVDRHPDRPAPVRVPPEHPGVGVAGKVLDAVLLARHVEDERVLAVVAREGADAVGREELVLVEQVAEDALELRPGEGREEPAPGVADEPLDGRSHVGEHLGVALPEERDQLHQLRVARHRLLLEHRARAQRQEPDHRADLQPERLAARQPEDVVVEAVLLVPHVVLRARRPCPSRR